MKLDTGAGSVLVNETICSPRNATENQQLNKGERQQREEQVRRKEQNPSRF